MYNFLSLFEMIVTQDNILFYTIIYILISIHSFIHTYIQTHQPLDHYQLQHELYSYPIKFGLCVPSVCSPHDVSRIFNESKTTSTFDLKANSNNVFFFPFIHLVAQPFNYSMAIKDECTVDSPNMMKDNLPGNAM